jgi:dihydrofolate reductase
MPMRVTIYESISVNGMIARPDGRGDFFTRTNWTAFVALAKNEGAMIWGRTTHDSVRNWSDGSLAQLEGVRGLVLTRDATYVAGDGWELAGSPQVAVDRLAADGAPALLVAGGRSVSTAFARARLAAALVVDVAPAVVARGMPLFRDEDLDIRLALEGVERLGDDVVRLRYRVT